MKRLIKKSSNLVKVYHGTSFENFESISNDGMLSPKTNTGVGSWNPGHIYLATQYSVASAHGYGANSRHYDLWDGGPPYVVLEFEIEESRLLSDPDNNPEFDNWEDSAAKNGQVAVFGEIDLPADTRVHFIGGEGWDTDLVTDIENWELFYEQNEEELFVLGEEDDE